MVPATIHYASLQKQRTRPFLWTLVFAVIGCLAILLWILTFDKEGGYEATKYLFPVSMFVLERLQIQSIPVAVWHAGALGQWLMPGVVIDLLRWWHRTKRENHTAGNGQIVN